MTLLREGEGISVPDYYSAVRVHQPKKEIAEYVESQGISVPRRFQGLNEALASGKPFIVRSEHPQDYDGISGLRDSFDITAERINEARKHSKSKTREVDWVQVFSKRADQTYIWDAADQIIAHIETTPQDTFEKNLTMLSAKDLAIYWGLTKADFNGLFRDTTYSYWELMGGVNRTVIADQAIQGRYHIFSKYRIGGDPSKGYGYVIVDGDTQLTHSWHLPEEADRTIPSLIDFYEQVRGLDRFNPNHCPIVETQTVGSDHYFLQYHRTRDFNQSTFVLEGEPKPDETSALLVVGATSPEGLMATINVRWTSAALRLEEEEGGLDMHWRIIYQELMAKRRRVQIEKARNFGSLSAKATDKHLSKSKLFKPALSIVLEDLDPILGQIPEPKDNHDIDFYLRAHPVNLHILSDGRKAYLSLVQ